jgi:hypothetical protein
MVGRLSALSAGRALLPRNIFSVYGTHFCYRLTKSPGLVRFERLGKLKKLNDLIGSRTRDLPGEYSFSSWPEWERELYRPIDSHLLEKLVPAFADRWSHVVSVTDPCRRLLGFLDRSRFFFQVSPQLYSRGWMDPVPGPLLLRKSGSAGNRTWTSGPVARNSDHYTTEAVPVLSIYYVKYRRPNSHIEPVTENPVFISYEHGVPVSSRCALHTKSGIRWIDRGFVVQQQRIYWWMAFNAVKII